MGKEKGKHKYTAKIRQPQVVAGAMLVPEGGELSQSEYDCIKKDAYGTSLIECEMITVSFMLKEEPKLVTVEGSLSLDEPKD